MRHRIRKPRLAALVGALAVVAATTFALAAPGAYAASPSDTRADFHSGNATNCGSGKNGIGVGGTIAFADGANPITTGPVQGTIVDGKFVNLTNPGSVTILAVVVKGGPAYNVYSANSGTPPGNHVPPAEAAPTLYKSPLNGGGNVPTISHWFVCYTGGETPTVGSLLVTKNLLPPPVGAPPQPTSFSVTVMCPANGSHVNQTFTLTPVDEGAEDGVLTDSHLITNIPLNDQCVVSEDVTGFDVSSIVTIDQPDKISVGGADATITNDFSGIGPEVVTRGPDPTVQVAAEVVVAPSFTG